MLARALELTGISTTSISLVREHTEKVKPPRALYVPFPFGHALGRPDDPELQHRVLRAALDLLSEAAGPVLRDLPEDAEPGDQPPAPPQASGIKPAEQVPDDVAMRFLEGFADGQDVDMAERPPEVALPNFVRYCADDLKALYFEGHLAMKPASGGEEIARWFWGETAAGRLLRRIRNRLDTSDDPRWKAAAFGIAR